METEEVKPNQADQLNDSMVVADTTELDKLVENLESSNEKIQLDAVTKIKKLVSTSTIPNPELENTIAKIINKGALEPLVKIAKTSDNFDLKHRAICTFVNISCGNSSQIKKMFEVGVIDIAVNAIDQAINNPDDEHAFNLAMESVWLLGNIIGESIEIRNACLDGNAFQKILELVSKHRDDKKLIDEAARSFKNALKKKPAPLWDQIADTYKFFQSIVEKGGKTDSEAYSLWGIEHISASYALKVVRSGCIPTLIGYMACGEDRFVVPALRAIGNLIFDRNFGIAGEVLKNSDCLPLLFKLCSSSRENIKIYAAWAIGTVVVGTPEQITKIIGHPEYLKQLNELLHDSSQKVRYRASCALADLASRATTEQIEQLVAKHKYLDSLLEIMKQPGASVHERHIEETIEKIVKLDFIKEEKGLIEQVQQICNLLSGGMRIINKHLTNLPNIGQSKVPKPQARKKIVKADNLVSLGAKKSIKRTKTMMTTISEGEEFIRGVNKRYRTRSSAAAHLKEKEGAAKKLRRTNTMKQTLKEAKKILEQIATTQKK